ncbi:MAG TPA: magnesium transporter [Candidatus Bathyarchaeia archaeon]|nr:magnesium transporter [Candidatus Bathyarchaeia archaeon]
MATQLATPSAVDQLWDRWPYLSHAERTKQFREMHTGEKADFFLALSPHDQVFILYGLPEEQRHVWMRLLPPDDAADLIQEAGRERREELLAMLDEPTRKEVVALLAYKEDEAGGLMNPRFARLRPDTTVDVAISYLRKEAPSVVQMYYGYVLDHDQRLLGVVSLRQLFTADPGKLVHEIMTTKDLVSVTPETDQKEVTRLVRDSRLLAIPVLDADRCMVGIVTVDDIVDVVEEQASRDIQNIGGMEALDTPYMHTSALEMVRKRAGWLAILFVGEMFTATAMGFFEEEIAKAVVLALFLPLIISSGGNSGSQATSLIIQAMAMGDVKLRDWFRVIRRELFSGLALGVILGAIGMTRIFVWQKVFGTYGHQTPILALTIFCSLIGVVAFGTIAGSMLPFILRRCGLNPATASAPFVATLVDVSGLIIYFTIARFIMLRP